MADGSIHDAATGVDCARSAAARQADGEAPALLAHPELGRDDSQPLLNDVGYGRTPQRAVLGADSRLDDAAAAPVGAGHHYGDLREGAALRLGRTDRRNSPSPAPTVASAASSSRESA